jgi:pimeloyl-ACP methyl ester carboxylesterase
LRYYVSNPPESAPLILYIQGSGCSPAFFEIAPGQYVSTIFSLTTVANRRDHAVMVVDKPFVPAHPPAQAGLGRGCPDAFNRTFALDPWVAQIEAALDHVLKSPRVRRGPILVIGISEGATVAAALAARDSRITHVALIGATGPGQYYDFVLGAYAANDDDASRLRALIALDAQLRAIRARPDSATEFAWGHSYKRWASFFRASTVANLQRSRARVYLVSGMADRSVPILSTELIYSELAAAGRDVQFRRLAGASHELVPAGSDFGSAMPEIEAEFARIVDWFSGAKIRKLEAR